LDIVTILRHFINALYCVFVHFVEVAHFVRTPNFIRAHGDKIKSNLLKQDQDGHYKALPQ